MFSAVFAGRAITSPPCSNGIGGASIFISSESAIMTPSEMVHYGMTKTAQLAVSRGLAEQTKGTKVTVNSVLPGPTRSEGIVEFLKGLASTPNATPEAAEKEFFEKYRSSSLLQRLIEDREVLTWCVTSRARSLPQRMAQLSASKVEYCARSLDRMRQGHRRLGPSWRDCHRGAPGIIELWFRGLPESGSGRCRHGGIHRTATGQYPTIKAS